MSFRDSRTRLAVLCSHFTPTRLHSDPPCSPLSASLCSAAEPRLPDSHNHQKGCVFCNIVRGQSPALKVVAAMCSKVPFISNAIMKATGCNSFNLLINNGAAAGQVIYHTHIHIIPRKAFDCLWASESLLRRPLNLDDDKVSQLAARIQEQLLLSDSCHDSKNEDFCSSKS